MNETERFWREFNDASDLLSRVPAAFPIRRDMAALRARHDRGDPNVVAYSDGQGNVERYALEFTAEQRQALTAAYKAARPRAPRDLDFEAGVFVDLLERWGDGLLDLAAINVPDQKDRKRSITSFSKAVEKFDEALSRMDSAALGWLYAVVADRLAADGVKVSPDDDRIVSMREHPMRAQVEAGELRRELRRIAAAIVDAASEASDTLPKHEHYENDPRLKTSQALERLVIEHGIEFEVKETGFAALALRTIFELGGIETEKVRHWLEKAHDHPD